MKKTTLQFNNLLNLVQFQKALDMSSFRINASALTLSGSFTLQDINLASEKYQALILKAEPVLEEQD